MHILRQQILEFVILFSQLPNCQFLILTHHLVPNAAPMQPIMSPVDKLLIALVFVDCLFVTEIIDKMINSCSDILEYCWYSGLSLLMVFSTFFWIFFPSSKTGRRRTFASSSVKKLSVLLVFANCFSMSSDKLLNVERVRLLFKVNSLGLTFGWSIFSDSDEQETNKATREKRIITIKMFFS